MQEVDIANLRPLPPNFFVGDVETVAKALIGTFLLTVYSDGVRTGGKIIETEAYDQDDSAAHCHPIASKRRKERSKAMLLSGGHAYVFEDRQMSCLNFTTGNAGFGSAVLIRALQPMFGVEKMRERRQEHYQAKYLSNGDRYKNYLCKGPCNLCEALAVTVELDGCALTGSPIELYARSTNEISPIVICGPRVGVPRAKDLPRRYALADSPFISKWHDRRYPLSTQ